MSKKIQSILYGIQLYSTMLSNLIIINPIPLRFNFRSKKKKRREFGCIEFFLATFISILLISIKGQRGKKR